MRPSPTRSQDGLRQKRGGEGGGQGRDTRSGRPGGYLSLLEQCPGEVPETGVPGRTDRNGSGRGTRTGIGTE